MIARKTSYLLAALLLIAGSCIQANEFPTFVKHLTSGKMIPLTVTKQTTEQELQQMLSRELQLEPQDIRVVYAGKTGIPAKGLDKATTMHVITDKPSPVERYKPSLNEHEELAANYFGRLSSTQQNLFLAALLVAGTYGAYRLYRYLYPLKKQEEEEKNSKKR